MINLNLSIALGLDSSNLVVWNLAKISLAATLLKPTKCSVGSFGRLPGILYSSPSIVNVIRSTPC